MKPLNSASGGFAKIEQILKWVRRIAINTERTQIHFLSDVLVAIASLNIFELFSSLHACRFFCSRSHKTKDL